MRTRCGCCGAIELDALLGAGEAESTMTDTTKHRMDAAAAPKRHLAPMAARGISSFSSGRINF